MNNILNLQTSRVKPLFDYLKKQQENQKFVKSVEITATFVLITFFLIFAIRPTIFTISNLLGDIKSKQLLRDQLRVKIQNVVKAQDIFSQAQERYSIINSSLPDRPQYFDSAGQIQQTSSASGLNISDLSYNLEDKSIPFPDPNMHAYTVTLNLKGGFPVAMKVISQLLQNRRLLNINSFGIAQNIDSSIKTASPSATTVNGTDNSFSSVFYYWP